MTLKIIYTDFVPPSGGIGATDFVRIYINDSLTKDEKEVVERHERSHCYLYHNSRWRKFLKANPDAKFLRWNVAADLEIARNIYDADDMAVINRPRSKLKTGIVADSFPYIHDDVLYAEDIYPLLKDEDFGCAEDLLPDASNSGDDAPPTSETVSAAKDKLSQDKKQKQMQEDTTAGYKGLFNRPPTLTNELDAILRVRAVRERSYRRASRRDDVGGLMAKGAKTTPRPPLVEIFVDRSGSFCPQKTQSAQSLLSKILDRYSASINKDVFFFGNNGLREMDTQAGGNTPYHLIAEHLNASRPSIAIIITDDDAANSALVPKETTVLCVPVGSHNTAVATAFGGKDVLY